MKKQTKFFAGFLLCVALLGPAVHFAWADFQSNGVVQQDSTAETGGANILTGTAIYRPSVDGAIRIGVGLSIDGIFSIVITDLDNVVLDQLDFNGTTGALTADKAYTFVWLVRSNRKYNFQTSVSSNVTLYVDFIKDGTT